MRVLASALFFVCACAELEERVAARSEPLIAAEVSDDLRVVAVMSGDHAVCTGVLIAPRVVATAAHCAVTEGLHVSNGEEAAAVTAARLHPAWTPAELTDDLGLLLLERELRAGAVPRALGDELAPLAAGTLVRLIGFGHDNPYGLGSHERRVGTARVVRVDADELTLEADPSAACHGDSGGPVLIPTEAGEVLAGLIAGGDAGCAGQIRAVRLDTRADFVAEVLALSEPGGVGARCLDAMGCVTSICHAPEDAPSRRYCIASCETDDACPGAMLCAEGHCRYPMPSPGAVGAACAADRDCESTLCAGIEGGEAICATRCFPENQPACPAEASCQPNVLRPGDYACVPSSTGGCQAGRRHSAAVALLVALLLVARQRTLRP